MSDILIFTMIVLFGLIPFGFIVVWALYRKTIIFQTALTIFIASMGVAIVGFIVGNKGFDNLWWAICVCLFWLVAMNFIAKRLIKKPIEELNTKIKELSKGNLNISVSKENLAKHNEIGEISKSVQNLVEELKEIVLSIQHSAEVIASMSEMVKHNSEAMAEGNSLQASSIEELSASMEEMAAKIKENASYSKETEQIAFSAFKNLSTSNNSVQESISAMQMVSERIGTINDIAFQTNILALNAAVEAARAGNHGRGFNVVASEVRKLAEFSKKISEEIISLSTKSMSISKEAGTNLTSVLPTIEQTAKLVKEISESCFEQNSGAQQINNAVLTLNEKVQVNVETSEELSEVAKNLNDQSASLVATLSFFSIKK